MVDSEKQVARDVTGAPRLTYRTYHAIGRFWKTRDNRGCA